MWSKAPPHLLSEGGNGCVGGEFKPTACCLVSCDSMLTGSSVMLVAVSL